MPARVAQTPTSWITSCADMFIVPTCSYSVGRVHTFEPLLLTKTHWTITERPGVEDAEVAPESFELPGAGHSASIASMSLATSAIGHVKAAHDSCATAALKSNSEQLAASAYAAASSALANSKAYGCCMEDMVPEGGVRMCGAWMQMLRTGQLVPKPYHTYHTVPPPPYGCPRFISTPPLCAKAPGSTARRTYA